MGKEELHQPAQERAVKLRAVQEFMQQYGRRQGIRNKLKHPWKSK